MSADIPQTTHFKFKWVDENGNEQGVFSKRAQFDGESLRLDDVEFPAAAIAQAEVRDRYVILQVMSDEGDPVGLLITVSGISAPRLKTLLDAARSATWAEMHRKELEETGQGHHFRSERCPHCGATLVLSDMAVTPQLYCHFCDTLTTRDNPPASEKEFRLCEECGMYSKPRKFTIFYFYFLLVVYGISQRAVWRCPACMRPEAWKMLFGNLLFIIGVPVAIVQLIRCYGGKIAGGPFAGLDDANIKTLRGDAAGGARIYTQIVERVPYCAGVKYNLGRGLIQTEDLRRAAATLEMALDDCSNYAPAYGALCHCYEELGEDDKLTELKRIWGDTATTEPESAEADSADPDSEIGS
jgi:hypothetical protein